MTTKHANLPELPDLNLLGNLQEVARGFARPPGVPDGTVLLILIASLLSLRSHQVTLKWDNEETHRPHLNLLFLTGHTVKHQSWISSIIGTLEQTVQNPSFPSPLVKAQVTHTFNSHVDKLNDEHLKIMAESDKATQELLNKARSEGAKLHDTHLARRVSHCAPSTGLNNFGFSFSTLVIVADPTFSQLLDVEYQTTAWQELFCTREHPFGQTVPATVVLQVNEKNIRRLWSRDHPSDFPWPLILPASGSLVPAELSEAEATSKWAEIVKIASDSWGQDPRHLNIDAYGYQKLSQVKTAVEKTHQHKSTPERFAWLLPLCTNIAIWDHLTRESGETISHQSWDVAAALSNWAITAYTFGSKSCGQPNAYPPRELADRDRIVTRFNKNPKISYRELVRALPKRPKGYWRKLHQVLKASVAPPPPNPLGEKFARIPAVRDYLARRRPTHPTSDGGGEVRLFRR